MLKTFTMTVSRALHSISARRLFSDNHRLCPHTNATVYRLACHPEHLSASLPSQEVFYCRPLSVFPLHLGLLLLLLLVPMHIVLWCRIKDVKEPFPLVADL